MSVRPFVVATSGLMSRLNLSPLGTTIAPADRFDPMHVKSAGVLDGIERLDRATFGGEGLGMPRWAYYDCVQVPGMVFGLGDDAANIGVEHRRKLRLPDEAVGIVPLVMVIAVPTLEEAHWLVHSIATLLGSRIVALSSALDALAARRVTGITQWTSETLSVHARFAPLELVSAWTPAHSEPRTCVFRYEVPAERVTRAVVASRTTPVSSWIDPERTEDLRALQSKIEAGARVSIAGPAEDGRIPLLEAGVSR